MSGKKRVTIGDVARKAGVSKQTVSRVINEKPDVAPETREHIQSIIQSMGYTPDPIARSMRGRTYTFGCITPNLSDYTFASIVQAAQTEARNSGYFFLTGSAPSEYDVTSLLDELLSRRVDGLMVINPRDDNRYRYLLPVIKTGLPVVYVKNTPVDEPVSAVVLDDLRGGYIAADYLISLGHISIVMIMGPENEECTHKRYAGYLNALGKAGITEDQRLIVQGDWSAQSGKKAIERLLSYPVRFTAIFAHNDRMALGAMRAVRDAGLRIPQDISIVGYDDLPLTAYCDPPLTTVQQPLEQFGQIGTQLLINALNQPETETKLVELEPSLTVRNSCSAIN
jgi:DNA-binding LacI/PurR family transcriptional regulator